MNGLFSYLMSEVAALESRLCRFRSLFLRERRVSPGGRSAPSRPGSVLGRGLGAHPLSPLVPSLFTPPGSRAFLET